MGELENRLTLIRDIAKDIKKYVGWWIALDDKDRIITYGEKNPKCGGKQ